MLAPRARGPWFDPRCKLYKKNFRKDTMQINLFKYRDRFWFLYRYPQIMDRSLTVPINDPYIIIYSISQLVYFKYSITKNMEKK